MLLIRLPFDWKTPLGYLVAWFLQFAGGWATYSVIIPIFSFMIGLCWLFTFVAEDITRDVMAFNANVAAIKNSVKKMKQFCGIVQLYSDATQ